MNVVFKCDTIAKQSTPPSPVTSTDSDIALATRSHDSRKWKRMRRQLEDRHRAVLKDGVLANESENEVDNRGRSRQTLQAETESSSSEFLPESRPVKRNPRRLARNVETQPNDTRASMRKRKRARVSSEGTSLDGDDLTPAPSLDPDPSAKPSKMVNAGLVNSKSKRARLRISLKSIDPDSDEQEADYTLSSNRSKAKSKQTTTSRKESYVSMSSSSASARRRQQKDSTPIPESASKGESAQTGVAESALPPAESATLKSRAIKKSRESTSNTRDTLRPSRAVSPAPSSNPSPHEPARRTKIILRQAGVVAPGVTKALPPAPVPSAVSASTAKFHLALKRLHETLSDAAFTISPGAGHETVAKRLRRPKKQGRGHRNRDGDGDGSDQRNPRPRR